MELLMKKPNPVKTVLSVAACKLTRAALRRTGRGGTAVPGIVAMKVERNILSAVSEGMKVVLVTGTNGKTTTCNMIEHVITACGHDCLLNRSGANLLHGIASDLISSADWRGKARYSYAVLECDEAALKQVVQFLTPAAIVVTNLFSDQVDRYGGVQNTLKEIRTAVQNSPASTLVLNAEDPLSSSLAFDSPARTVYYGLESSVGVQGDVDLADAGVCPKCGTAYEYDYHIYAHLGGFRCPKCGLRRRDPDVAVTAIRGTGADGSTVRMRVRSGAGTVVEEPAVAEAAGAQSVSAEAAGTGAADREREVHIALPAVYNVYNAAAAVAAAIALDLPADRAMEALSSVRSSFGRMETFDLNGVRAQMILVKNPAGCNQAFTYVTSTDEDYSAVLILNNRTGDGVDFSWIESTDYEKLCADPHLKKIYYGGDRAEDLKDRLLRAGADPELLTPAGDYTELVETLAREGRTVYLLPNYTGMMDMRPALCKATGTGDFWE